jgi:hypothetical protein
VRRLTLVMYLANMFDRIVSYRWREEGMMIGLSP